MNVEDMVERLFREAITWKYRYYKSNPDVGMGPSILQFAKDIKEKSGIPYSDEMITDTVEFVVNNERNF